MDTKVNIKATEIGVEVEDGIQFSACQCPKAILTEYETKKYIDSIVDRSGFTREISVLKRIGPHDENGGFTYICILSESHVVVSTWPEYLGVRIYLAACNYKQNNRPKAENLIRGLRKLFRPTAEKAPKVDPVTGTRLWSW